VEKASGDSTLLRTLLAGAGVGAGTETASGDGLGWVEDDWPAGVRGGIIWGCATAVGAAVARALSILSLLGVSRYYLLYYR
jgi:hypothetical protein